MSMRGDCPTPGNRWKRLTRDRRPAGFTRAVRPSATAMKCWPIESIDAIFIGAPDHWHVPLSVAAIQAGKDVACEKPLTRLIAEGRQLSDLATKHKRVFRNDSEFRSLENFHRAVELVRNGRIGKLHTIRSGVPGTDVGCPAQPDMPVPDGLDYERWQGPAPRAAYTEKRVHPPKSYDRPGWMRHTYYCDGMVTDSSVEHLNDIAQWGNNTERTGPVEVEARGTFPPADSFWNVMLSFEAEYRYANGVRLYYKTDNPYVRFEGDDGCDSRRIQQAAAGVCRGYSGIENRRRRNSLSVQERQAGFHRCGEEPRANAGGRRGGPSRRMK